MASMTKTGRQAIERAAERATRERNIRAFDNFRNQATKKPPTQHHRPALWENMLGTLYARHHNGETKYFDYDYADAIAFVGEARDVRVYRNKKNYGYDGPRVGQLVWWVLSDRYFVKGE